MTWQRERSSRDRPSGRAKPQHRFVDTRKLHLATAITAAGIVGLAEGAQVARANVNIAPYYEGCTTPATDEPGHGVWTDNSTRLSNVVSVFPDQCSGTGTPYACAAIYEKSYVFHSIYGPTSPICQTRPSRVEVSITPASRSWYYKPLARVCHKCGGETFNHKQWAWASETTTNEF